MEYHENPEERREENGEEKKEEFSFMQETIKDEDAGYRKIRNTVMKYAGEWSSRLGRRFPASVPGLDVKLSDGSRELLAMVSFEGHPRMDIATYCEGIITAMWGHKFRIPDDYLHDGEVVSMRGFADLEPGVLEPFVSTYKDDILSDYDTPIGREIVQRFG